MTAVQWWNGVAAELALAVALIGLFRTGRWRLCYTFTAYLAVVLATETMITALPEIFWRKWFWIGKQGVISALRTGLALELAYRTFGAFPGAWRAARAVCSVLIAGGAGLAWALTGSYLAHLPAVETATLWVFLATLGVALYYRVPVHPYRLTLLATMGAYVALFSIVVRIQSAPEAVAVFNRTVPFLYTGFALLWAYVANAPESAAARDHVETVGAIRRRFA